LARKLLDDHLAQLKKIQDAEDTDMETDVHNHFRKKQHNHPESQDEEAIEKDTGKDTRNLLIVIGAIVLLFMIFLSIRFIYNPRQLLTIDELHEANMNGEIKEGQGYIYNGYSFITLGGVWYSRVQKGNTIYDVTFNYDPKTVEGIPVEGTISPDFDKDNDLYITFDTNVTGAKYIAVANSGLSTSLIKGFQYNLTASCTNNESSLCRKTGVVNCGDENRSVIYFKESNITKITLEENCITIQGYGPEIIKAKDRLLMSWYGIIKENV